MGYTLEREKSKLFKKAFESVFYFNVDVSVILFQNG